MAKDFALRRTTKYLIHTVKIPIDNICMLKDGKIRAEKMIITELDSVMTEFHENFD